MEIIGAVARSQAVEVRVTRDELDGAVRVNVRLWHTPERGKPYPLRYGLSLPPALWQDLLPALAEAVGAPSPNEE